MRDGWVWYDGSVVWAEHCVYCGNVPEYDKLVEDAMEATERWLSAKDAVVAAALAGDDVTEEMRESVRNAKATKDACVRLVETTSKLISQRRSVEKR